MTLYENLFRWAGTSLCLISLAGCSKPQKPEPVLPIASGEIIRCVLHHGIVYDYRNGESTNKLLFTEGKVDIYSSGMVIITERDGTKHCGADAHFSEITFK